MGSGRSILPPGFSRGDRRPSHELSPVGGHRHVSADWGAIPDNLEGVPFPIWGRPPAAGGDSNVAVHQVAQPRWVKVTASLVFGEVMRMKLIDSADKPLLDPAWPPMACARRLGEGDDITTDTLYWNDIVATDTAWLDDTAHLLPNEDIAEAPMIGWYLRRVNDPVPCWELTVAAGFYDTVAAGPIGPNPFVDVNLDFLGTGIGGYAESQRDITVPDGQSLGRIWYLTSDNAAVDHGDSPSLAAANELAFGSAAHDSTRTTGTYFYLTSDGTSTGSDIYDTTIRPACIVLADPEHSGFAGSPLKAGGAENTWRPGSHGLGSRVTAASTLDPFTLRSGLQVGFGFASTHLLYPLKFGYYSFVQRDSGTSRWRVWAEMARFAPTGITRTLYLFTWGKRA